MDVLGSVWKNGIPLEVVDTAYRPIQTKIAKRLGGQAKLRMAHKKMVGNCILQATQPCFS